jgi:hypothetical protein
LIFKFAPLRRRTTLSIISNGSVLDAPSWFLGEKLPLRHPYSAMFNDLAGSSRKIKKKIRPRKKAKKTKTKRGKRE